MTLKFSEYDAIHTYTPREVANMLVDCGYIDLDDDECITDVRLECGSDLEIDFSSDRSENYTVCDIRDAFTASDYCAWAKDENDNDVLVCFEI